jgi:hypothetical protein
MAEEALRAIRFLARLIFGDKKCAITNWALLSLRATPLSEAAEGELQKSVADLQGEIDMA